MEILATQLLDDLVRELKTELGHWPAIARAGDTSYRTVSNIASGRNVNPTIGSLEAIRKGLKAVREARQASHP